MEFDESNGSQGEVVGYDHVGDEEVKEVLKICLLEISNHKLEKLLHHPSPSPLSLMWMKKKTSKFH
jgi:hypothetical protein